ncbi:MliC family protein [Deinococcus metalli]|uniref:MliC family protein n=1 Tax=Deinococcus metalli TaxID=1141878 RepID=UPI00161B44BC|nr:MliC family protein [Deinococcus metalli]
MGAGAGGCAHAWSIAAGTPCGEQSGPGGDAGSCSLPCSGPPRCSPCWSWGRRRRSRNSTCQGGWRLDVASTTFAVLTWSGVRYGLAQAVSESGARYAALAGGPNQAVVEKWEHHE